MKKPENFNKVDNEQIIVGSKKLTIDVSTDGFFVMDNRTTDWNNVVLFEMDWEKAQYNVKICILGEGTDGWYLHEKLPIPKEHMLTVERFKDFAISNMYDVASKVDLTDVRPNMMGITDLITTEIKHNVQSSSGPITYIVTENTGGIAGEWGCTCPAYQYSKETPQTCKHIKQLKP
jgi:hypothetical protein